MTRIVRTVRAALILTAATGTGLIASVASATEPPEYTPEDVSPVGLFDWGDMGVQVLTIMGSALAAVAVFKISVGIGKKVIAWFGGRA